MRFTRNSKVTIVLSNISIICFIAFFMATISLAITANVSKEVAENIIAPTFEVTIAAAIFFNLLWLLSGKLFPPIFDYIVFKEEEKIYFLIDCEFKEVDNNTLRIRDEKIVFYSEGQEIEDKYDENVIEYLKKLGAKFE